MFDDQMQNNPNNTPPGNLPVGEPEDMFAGVEKSAQPANDIGTVGDGAPATPPAPSALNAGILRPKQPAAPAVDYGVPPSRPVAAGPAQEVYKIKEPALTRGLITVVIILVVVAILGGGGWWIYNSFVKPDNSQNLGTEIEAPLIETEEAVVAPDEEEPLATGGEEEAVSPGPEASEAAVDVVDEQILFGEPVDKDGDNLDDLKEAELGTDPANWDSDNDELGDGDEILIWQTDPLNPDSDGDSYLDGAEVKNGYKPNGPGRIFEVPSE